MDGSYRNGLSQFKQTWEKRFGHDGVIKSQNKARVLFFLGFFFFKYLFHFQLCWNSCRFSSHKFGENSGAM